MIIPTDAVHAEGLPVSRWGQEEKVVVFQEGRRRLKKKIQGDTGEVGVGLVGHFPRESFGMKG